jgi:ABC-type branched-subunit amino acid transport system substrate-binding protein
MFRLSRPKVEALTLKDVSALQQDDIGSLREAFINTANSYVGVTGRTELNDAGDRKYGSYDFWAVRPVYKDVNNKSSFEWANVVVYPIGIDNS